MFEHPQPEKCKVILYRVSRIKLTQPGIKFFHRLCVALFAFKQTQLARHIAGVYIQRAGKH